MKALRAFLSRLFAPKPHAVPVEVRRRLRVHAVERRMRMAKYAATWQRTWDAEREQAEAEARRRRGTFTVAR